MIKQAQDRVENINRMSKLPLCRKIHLLYSFYKGTENKELASKYKCSINTINNCVLSFSKDKFIMGQVRVKLNKEKE